MKNEESYRKKKSGKVSTVQQSIKILGWNQCGKVTTPIPLVKVSRQLFHPVRKVNLLVVSVASEEKYRATKSRNVGEHGDKINSITFDDNIPVSRMSSSFGQKKRNLYLDT